MKHKATNSRVFNTLLFLFLSMLSQNVMAQDKQFEFSVVPAAEAEGMQVYISTQNLAKENKTTEAKYVGGKFSVTIQESNSGFYNLVVVKGNTQNIQPMYFSSNESAVGIEVLCENGRVALENSVDNKALSQFNEILISRGTVLWSGQKFDLEQQKNLIAGYKQAADSIVAEYACTPSVRKYIEINGYTSAYNAYSALPRALGIKRSEIPFSLNDVLPEPSGVLDHELTALFPMGKHVMLMRIPQGSLSERLNYIDVHYKNEVLKKMLVSSMAESFVTNTKAAANYEAGLAELTVAVEKYGVDKKYIEQYAKLRNVIPGSAFPEEVVLEDINGNKVDFSLFKGKYVYIDLWASWCGPCMREIPHLQALDSEFDGSNVVFVSISVDTSKEAWKKRVAGLKLQGHQYIDADGKLSAALNIQGIPHFLIYDKEGKLHTYKAQRPSSGDTLKRILKQLN